MKITLLHQAAKTLAKMNIIPENEYYHICWFSFIKEEELKNQSCLYGSYE